MTVIKHLNEDCSNHLLTIASMHARRIVEIIPTLAVCINPINLDEFIYNVSRFNAYLGWVWCVAEDAKLILPFKQKTADGNCKGARINRIGDDGEVGR